MASSYLFIAEPADNLKCIICLELASDPKQHGDCGKLLCSKCIDKNGNKPCPNCMAKDPQYFKDRRSLMEIRDLRVRCDRVEEGCDWEGTVGIFDDHVTKCVFTLVSCSNKCKVEGGILKLMRKNLKDHLKTVCLNRAYKCVYCELEGTFASITEEHDSVCIMKVVSCPNTKCTSTMERGLIKKHVETDCTYTVVACKYVSIGCSMEKMRLDMKQHEEDDKSHLSLALDKIVKLVGTTSSHNTTISSLKVTSSSLESTTSMLMRNVFTLSRDKSKTFYLPGFSEKKGDNEVFYSEPFHTSPGCYKMCVMVYPNGVGDVKGTHVSVFFKLLEGPNDDNLPWPFLGTVTVELLNQFADENHCSMKLSIDSVKNVRVGSTLGYHKFLTHIMLSHDTASNTQYLKEDTLYFRVAVEVDNHKPWLDCSIYHTK